MTAQDLIFDLRENRTVSTEKAAFLDLYRSSFLHQLRVLKVSFARPATVRKDNATWTAAMVYATAGLQALAVDAASIVELLERGKMGNQALRLEVGRRLSMGVPAELGAGCFRYCWNVYWQGRI